MQTPIVATAGGNDPRLAALLQARGVNAPGLAMAQARQQAMTPQALTQGGMQPSGAEIRAKVLIDQAMDRSPMTHPLQAVGRVVSAYTGSKLAKQAKREQEQEAERQRTRQAEILQQSAGLFADADDPFAGRVAKLVGMGAMTAQQAEQLFTTRRGQDMSAKRGPLATVTVNGDQVLPTRDEIMRGDIEARAGDARTRISEIRAGLSDARDKLPRMQRALQILETVNTGTLATAKLQAQKLAEAFGAKIDVNKVGSIEELQALLGDFVMERIQETKGSVSEKEMELFTEYSPSLSKTVQGNRQILNFRIAQLQRNVKMAAMARDLQKKNMTSIEIADALDQYMIDNDLSLLLMSEEELEALASGNDR